MKTMLGMMSTTAAALSTMAFLAMSAPAAQAGEFCITDSNGMRGCGYATMEQCHLSASGRNGTCARDPFFDSTGNGNPSNAMAYQPRHLHAKRTVTN